MRFLCAFAIVAVLTALHGCSDSTPIPKTNDEKLQLAVRIATIQFDTPEMSGLMANVEAQARQIPSAFCDSMPPEKLPECLQMSARYRPAMEGVVEQTIVDLHAMRPMLVNEMAIALASVYTGEELARLLDLYDSPAYKMLVERRAEVSEAYLTKAMRLMQPQLERLKTKLLEAIPEAATALQ